MVEEYTYLSKSNDRDLESFSIEKDFEYFIPLLKEALLINPNLKFISAPWSAPADFKTTVVGEILAVQTLAGFWIFLEIFKKSVLYLL